MVERCNLVASEISSAEVISNTTISKAVSAMVSSTTRLVITDESGIVLYDSESDDTGIAASLPEVTEALKRKDVFSWTYHDGIMCSRAAAPIVSYGILIGCVYAVEYDTAQGKLIQSLHTNILTISLVLEFILIVFSVIFSVAFTRRLHKIRTSMRIIREGDYSHKVQMGGNDELTVLGEEFNDLVARLQTSEQKRTNFVSDASHELKTPLASIKLLSDSILQNEMDADTVREFVGDIGREADRLNRMSQKLLLLSRIDSQADMDCEIVYIAPTVERVLRMLAPVAQKNQIRIQTDLLDDRTVLVIEDDLYQIVFNLIENAIKYNRPGGDVTVRLAAEGDYAALHIRDTGAGIPEESISHIFERFYRVDKARSRKSGGSGLGLSIVYHMVERNNGSIDVQSQPDCGTEFTVRFPIFDTDES